MTFGKVSFFILFFFFSHSSLSQVNRYMVFFKDKNGTPYSLSQPDEFLSPKAIARRTNQSIVITEVDLPVNPTYCQQIKDAGIPIYFKTRWFNGVLVQCDASLVSALQAFNFVSSVELVAPNALLTGGRLSLNMSPGTVNSTEAYETDVQLSMLGAEQMQADNYRGETITIAVIDAGFPGVDTKPAFKKLFDDGRINLSASYDFVFNSSDVFKQSDHGTKVLSIIGGLVENEFYGCAYKANFQLYLTEHDPTEYRVEEYNWLFAAERADSAGVDIVSTSLGYNTFDNPAMDYKQEDMDGKTSVVSRAAKLISARGVLVVCSAGNEGANGWEIITAPADVEDVIAVGNINSQGVRSLTSSVGPTADGRIKPDVVALGSGVVLVGSSGTISTGSGTSFAAPLVAGLAAGVWQKYPELTAKQVAALLRKTASQHKNPDNSLGFGIPNYTAASNYMLGSNQVSTFEVFTTENRSIAVRPKNPDDISSCNYELISLQGISVGTGSFEFNWISLYQSIPTTELSPGIYLLRLQSGGKFYTFKLFLR